MSVVVTGASGAIGSAIVNEFARNGTTVMAHDIRPVSGDSDNVIALTGDLRDQACLEALRQTAETHEATAVVAAHGTFKGSGALTDLNANDIRELMEINFAVIPHLLDALTDCLRASRGVFIAVASQAALRGEPTNSTYCASKWAVRAWAAAMDRELRSDGVRVRAICPGRIDSPLHDRALETFAKAEGVSLVQYSERVRAEIPARRFGQPGEIAAAVQYLAASPARPSVLAVNGGEVPW